MEHPALSFIYLTSIIFLSTFGILCFFNIYDLQANYKIHQESCGHGGEDGVESLGRILPKGKRGSVIWWRSQWVGNQSSSLSTMHPYKVAVFSINFLVGVENGCSSHPKAKRPCPVESCQAPATELERAASCSWPLVPPEEQWRQGWMYICMNLSLRIIWTSKDWSFAALYPTLKIQS